LAIDEINEAGGINGKKVEGVYADVVDLSVEAATSAYEVLQNAGVKGVFSGYSCATTAPLTFWGPTRIPFIEASYRDTYASLVKSDPKKYANVFQNSFVASKYGVDTDKYLFDIPKKMGWTPPNKKIASIIFDDPSYSDPANKFQELAEKRGYEFPVKKLYQYGYGKDWRAVLTKIDAERPAFVTVWTILPDDAANFTVQFKEYFGDDYDGLLYFLYVPVIPEYWELAGDAADSVVFNVNPIWFFNDAVKQFDKRWDAKYKDPRLSSIGLIVYDAVMMWYEGVKQVGCVECYDKIGDAIRARSHNGLAGVYEFLPDNSCKYGDAYIPMGWYQIQGKDLASIEPPAFATGKKYVKQPWMKK
jgi:ABC-type branched-subunit amino acid transport system substrate-binding protein